MKLILAVLLLAPVQLFATVAVPTQETCSLGLFGSCFVNSTITPEQSSSPWRIESFSGYKTGMSYYEEAEKNCSRASDCRFDPEGEVYGADIYYNIDGNNRSADYLDLGIQYSSIPVAKWESSETFTGENSSLINQGSGSLRYHFVRFNIRRGTFLYFLKSRYLISSFGVGLAIPESEGTGEGFVGARRISPTIGGKLGFQNPLTASLDIGLATNWGVLWYGSDFTDSAFISGYGLNLSYRAL